MLRRARPWTATLVILGALLLLLPLPSPAAATSTSTADDAGTALLQKYAPHVAVRTHLKTCGKGERYLPVAVDTVLGRSDVVLRDADGGVVKRAPTVADLANGGEDLWLDLPGNALIPDCTYEKWFRTLDASPAIYGRIVHEGDTTVAQYWLYWVFNQWNDVHESDWEMAQVTFDVPTAEEALSTDPTLYAYAQHEGSQYAIPADGDTVVTVDGQHPVVFSGSGSHASYFESGLWFGKSASTGFGCDDTTGPVEVLEPQLIVLPEGVVPPTTGPFAWLSYRGHWGEQAPSFANGPTGPLMKQQWSEPVTWVEDLGREHAVRVPFAVLAGDRRVLPDHGLRLEPVQPSPRQPVADPRDLRPRAGGDRRRRAAVVAGDPRTVRPDVLEGQAPAGAGVRDGRRRDRRRLRRAVGAARVHAPRHVDEHRRRQLAMGVADRRAGPGAHRRADVLVGRGGDAGNRAARRRRRSRAPASNRARCARSGRSCCSPSRSRRRS